MKRIIDIILSFLGILILSPLFILISLLVYFSSSGDILFRQPRVGKDGKLFTLLKFRTMVVDADRQGQLSLGENDPRIHCTGHWLRRYKLDELPQLFNVLKGEMSIVGPRPEVPRYVEMYSESQRKVLSLRPGLTDYASLQYYDEGSILSQSSDPEKTYIEEILPRKLELGLQYVNSATIVSDFKIIFLTLKKILC